jgi:predicted ferric reductase
MTRGERLDGISPHGLSSGLAALLFVAAALLPLALALLSGEEPGFWHEEAGIALGLVGLSLLLLQFAHAGRWRQVSDRTGIDVTMRFHRAAALLLAAFVLLHPLAFLAPLLLRDPVAGLARLWAMFTSPRMASGTVAWLALLATVVLALARRRLRYERWRLLHGLGAVLAAGAGVAHARSVGLHSGQGAMSALWLAGLTGALLLLAWSWPWKAWRLGRGGWRVAAVEWLGPGYWELTLSGPAPPRHAAGQFAWLAFGRAAPWDDNPFSYSSAPGEDGLRFVIREAGDRTGTIGALPPGLAVRVDGPHGAFTLDRAGDGPLLLVAGGAGIAPILALARDLDRRGVTRPVALLHGARTADRLVRRDELSAIAARHGWRTLFLSEEDAPPGVVQGRMERERIAALIEGWAPGRVTAMMCGPEPMTMAVAGHLEALGLAPGRIVYELFDYA